jgi:hypothetical protein
LPCCLTPLVVALDLAYNGNAGVGSKIGRYRVRIVMLVLLTEDRGLVNYIDQYHNIKY